MHVDVDVRCRQRQLKIQRRPDARWNRRPVRRFGGADNSGVAHGPSVNGEVYAPSTGADLGWTLDEPGDVKRSAHVLDVNQASGDGRAMQSGDALAERGCARHGESRLSIVRQ